MPDEMKADIHISDMNFSVRVSNSLLNNNITTLSELCFMTRVEVLRFPKLGRKALSEIEEILQGRGLRLSTVSSWLVTSPALAKAEITRLREVNNFNHKENSSIRMDLELEHCKCNYLYNALQELNDAEKLPRHLLRIIDDAKCKIREFRDQKRETLLSDLWHLRLSNKELLESRIEDNRQPVFNARFKEWADRDSLVPSAEAIADVEKFLSMLEWIGVPGVKVDQDFVSLGWASTDGNVLLTAAFSGSGSVILGKMIGEGPHNIWKLSLNNEGQIQDDLRDVAKYLHP